MSRMCHMPEGLLDITILHCIVYLVITILMSTVVSVIQVIRSQRDGTVSAHTDLTYSLLY